MSPPENGHPMDFQASSLFGHIPWCPHRLDLIKVIKRRELISNKSQAIDCSRSTLSLDNVGSVRLPMDIEKTGSCLGSMSFRSNDLDKSKTILTKRKNCVIVNHVNTKCSLPVSSCFKYQRKKWLDMPDWVKDSEDKTADVILGFVNKTSKAMNVWVNVKSYRVIFAQGKDSKNVQRQWYWNDW